MRKTSKRTVMKTDGLSFLSDQQIGTILRETFEGRHPACDIALLGSDLAAAFRPLTRNAKDRAVTDILKKIQKKLEITLRKVENTPKHRWILAAVGRNYAARAKERGIKARDMTSYDALVWSSGYARYEDFVEAEIQKFFRLKDQFLEWLSDDDLSSRMFGFLMPATKNSLIAVTLPAIFRKHFPGEPASNSPDSRCTKFIGHVLRETGLYGGIDPSDMITKRRSRAKSSRL
jgi:hypothetical protein